METSACVPGGMVLLGREAASPVQIGGQQLLHLEEVPIDQMTLSSWMMTDNVWMICSCVDFEIKNNFFVLFW